MNNTRFELENGPDIVSLNFTHTILSDVGVWRCDVRVVSDQDLVQDGRLVESNSTVIDIPLQQDLELIIIGRRLHVYLCILKCILR